MTDKPKQICIQADHDGLMEAAREILSPEEAEVILESLKARKRWRAIQNEYALARSRGFGGNKTIYALAKKHKYSVKTIESIIYTRP